MSSLYAKLIQVIEKKITPMAGAVGQQKYVTSIRDGFITALPFMIVGSFAGIYLPPLLARHILGLRQGMAAILARSP